MKTCGIYQIINLKNKKRYIGQSINIKSRWIRHRYELNNNIHINPKLQRSWNKYGENSFEFKVIFACGESELSFFEKQEVERILIRDRYNINKDYDTLKGKNNPFYGKNHTKKVKKKLSELASKRIGYKNSNFGNKYSNETKIKAGHNKKTKLKPKQVFEIIEMKNKSHQEIANIYNVSRSLITRILNGKRWSLITGDKL
jgi:hypothetical protein